MKYSVAAASVLAAIASAKKCQELTVQVQVSARNGLFNKAAITPHTEIAITDIALELSRHGYNYTADVLEGYATVAGSYHIAATYCDPDSGPSSAIQILTHGIGFDRSYWDLPFHNYNYSYVDVAVDQYGYSTFTWDRLGIGMSQHGEPVNEIQAFLEVDALRDLTQQIKAGSISGLPSNGFSIYTHAGHSFGSQHTYLLTAMYPSITDCVTLQGFSQNGSFAAEFILGSNFIQANTVPALSAYPDGYLAGGTIQGVQIDFFAPGDFDPAILKYAYKHGEPVTVGELLTFGGETAVPNTFAGPVHIVTGEHDTPYCGGNCYDAPVGYPNIPSTSKQFLVNAAPFKVDIINGAGHGLNLEYTHPETYAIMNNFLLNNGCGPSGSGSGKKGHHW